MSFVVLYYDGVFRSEEEDPIYLCGEIRVVLIDNNVALDHFKSQIRRITRSGSSAIRIIFSLKSEIMSIYACLYSGGFKCVVTGL